MKRIYDINLIKDYIEGNDIENYKIDELENDYQFMMSVINYTKDINMYSLCSKEVQNNYEFVKFIINKFHNNIDFIHKVASTFLDNNDDEIKRTELCIIMRNLIDKKANANHLEYSAIPLLFYTTKMIEVEYCIMLIETENINPEMIGKGFIFVKEMFASNEIILKYFAEMMIFNILVENEKSDLEKEIHQDFDSFNMINNIGINNYIINKIRKYDINLASYATCHKEVLNNIKKEINRIKDNWDLYVYKDTQNKYMNLFEEFHQYITECEMEFLYSETDILYYIANELGITEEMKKYDPLYGIEPIENIDIDKSEMDLTELKHYLNLKRIITNNLGLHTEKLLSSPKRIPSNNKSKILVFDPNIKIKCENQK